MTTAYSSQTPFQRTTHDYTWQGQGKPVRVTYETAGDGLPVLLLPAFSTVSTREELYGILEHLAPEFRAIALDWPGFGDSDRLPLEYHADLYLQFLSDFVRDQFSEPVAVVAAGHAAGYVMRLAQQRPHLWSKIVLIAPTWRGPLPTMGAPTSVASVVRQAVRSPILGQALYVLNTTPSFLRLMYRRHVYADETKLTPEFIAHKCEITQRPGARYAPAAFVTGALDPAQSREEFLQGFQIFQGPVLAVLSEAAPPGSKAEMEAIAPFPQVEIKRLPGSLGIYEEYAQEIAEWVVPFLR
jgi:pimeloyl-ACP methyl ester carboxylesterase